MCGGGRCCDPGAPAQNAFCDILLHLQDVTVCKYYDAGEAFSMGDVLSFFALNHDAQVRFLNVGAGVWSRACGKP